MRVTNNMLNATVVNNITASYERMEHYQWQESTGKAYKRPSDNPIAVNLSLNYKASLKEFEQYTSNIDGALSWLDGADTALRDASSLLQRAKTLSVSGANATNGQSELDAIADEVGQILENMIDIGNTQFAGRYIFGGFHTTSAPFEATDSPATSVEYVGDEGNINYEIEKGVSTSVNLNGDQVFKTPTDVFGVLIDLRDHLLAGDYSAVSQDTSNIDDALGMITNALMNVGSKTNRLETTQDRLEQGKLNLKEALSNTEEADIAEVIVNLKTEETVYQAALSTGASIIKRSLIDYLG
jgi:flagellar hook-associated protein 3 FlgL